MEHNKGFLFGILVGLLLLSGTLHAATPNTALSAYLSTYLSNSVISSSTYTNATFGSGHYTIIRLPSGQYLVAVAKGTSYLLVTNVSVIQSVLSPYLISSYYPNSATLGKLNTLITLYKDQSNAPLADCLVETGLRSGATCTYGNNCASCFSVPVCREALSGTGGVTGPLGTGIMNFSSQYNELNSSYNQYFSLLANITPTNINSNLAQMSSALSAISKASSQIPNNPIFPLPLGFNEQQLSVCPSYSTLASAPWYCQSLGFCETVSFNSSALSQAQTLVSSLQSLPVSNSTIHKISVNSSNLVAYYSLSLAKAKNYTLFNATMKLLLPAYNNAVANATIAYNRTQNPSITTALIRLKAIFATVQSAGPDQNVTKANTLIMGLISNLTAVSNVAGSAYQQMSMLAANNTLAVLIAQNNYKPIPTALAVLASKEQDLNARILQQNLNTSAIRAATVQLQNISSGLKGFGGSSYLMQGFVKSFDSGFVSGLLNVLNMSPEAKMALSPTLATIESLIIGLVIILLVYLLLYGRVKRKKHQHHHHMAPHVVRAWKLLFVALFVLLLIYLYATYIYASQANQFLPLSKFNSALGSSKRVYLITNTSEGNNLQLQQCITAIKGKLSAASITSTAITGSGDSCTMIDSSGNNLTGIDCYNNLLSLGSPAIEFGGLNATFAYSGLYGNVAHVGLGLAYGSSCYISKMIAVH
jgi:hypothetical protein